MSLDTNDKTIIIYITVLFVVVIFISFLISFLSVKTDVEYNLFNESVLNESEFQNIFGNLNNTHNYTLFEENNDSISKNNTNNDFNTCQFNVFQYDVCTPLMNFSDFVKINKRYKFDWGEISFFVNEKYVSSTNSFHIVDMKQNVNYEDMNFDLNSQYYYDSSGECLKIFYDFSGYGEENYEADCSGNSFSFICEEMLENLNYSGMEKYYVYGENYDVMVYSNEDESVILKYGKEIPILFYLHDYTSKRIKIELLGLEG